MDKVPASQANLINMGPGIKNNVLPCSLKSLTHHPVLYIGINLNKVVDQPVKTAELVNS